MKARSPYRFEELIEAFKTYSHAYYPKFPPDFEGFCRPCCAMPLKAVLDPGFSPAPSRRGTPAARRRGVSDELGTAVGHPGMVLVNRDDRTA